MQFGWDTTFKALLASCWAEDPRDRPGFSFVHVRERAAPTPGFILFLKSDLGLCMLLIWICFIHEKVVDGLFAVR